MFIAILYVLACIFIVFIIITLIGQAIALPVIVGNKIADSINKKDRTNKEEQDNNGHNDYLTNNEIIINKPEVKDVYNHTINEKMPRASNPIEKTKEKKVRKVRNKKTGNECAQEELEAKQPTEFEELVYCDPITRLIWVRNLSGESLKWQNALNYVSELNYAGYHDWRIPTSDELLERFFEKKDGRFVQREADDALHLNLAGFKNVKAGKYWRTYRGMKSSWTINGSKDTDPYDYDYNEPTYAYIWPVRGPL